MNTNAIAKQYRLEQWAQMISECRSSGIPVKDWCRKNSITKGNYYYRLRRVREAMIMATEQTRVVEISKDMYTPDIPSTVHGSCLIESRTIHCRWRCYRLCRARYLRQIVDYGVRSHETC